MNTVNIKSSVKTLLPTPLGDEWELRAPNPTGSDKNQIDVISSYLRSCACRSSADVTIINHHRDLITNIATADSLNLWIRQFQLSLLPILISGVMPLDG